MLFVDMLKELKAGEKMCRVAWTFEDGYLALMPGMQYVWKIILHPNPNAGNYIFTVGDFDAEDWIKFQIPHPAEQNEVVAA